MKGVREHCDENDHGALMKIVMEHHDEYRHGAS